MGYPCGRCYASMDGNARKLSWFSYEDKVTMASSDEQSSIFNGQSLLARRRINLSLLNLRSLALRFRFARGDFRAPRDCALSLNDMLV